MRQIRKGNEPASLTNYRQPGATYDGDDAFATVKDDIRASLVEEQGGICCYCMTRIDHRRKDRRLADTMRIEHWAPQSKHPERTLEWRNLFGSCLGNPGAPPFARTCDPSKDDTEIVLHPMNQTQMGSIRYMSTGEIRSDDSKLNAELDEVLNLNAPNLLECRKQAMDGTRLSVEKRFHNKKATAEWLQRELAKLSTAPHPGFVGAIEFWLRRQLARSK